MVNPVYARSSTPPPKPAAERMKSEALLPQKVLYILGQLSSQLEQMETYLSTFSATAAGSAAASASALYGDKETTEVAIASLKAQIESIKAPWREKGFNI